MIAIMTKFRHAELKDSNGHVVYVMDRQWEVQPPPYFLPLEFHYSTTSISGGSSTGASYDVTNVNLGAPGRDRSADANNNAYASLTSQLSDASQWANNLLEANQAISGAAARITQIARFAGKLRRGDISGAAKVLAVPVPKSLKGKKAKLKSFGDQFLEFHFGWVPLAQDIHGAMETLSDPDFGLKYIRARATVNDSYVDRNQDYWDGRFHSLDVWNTYVVYKRRYGVVVRVNNANAYLASSLGLVNPASILWEAVPFSFVADWFGNVGQVLASATDFVGLDITLAYNTSSEGIQKSYFGTFTDDVDSSHDSSARFLGRKFSVSRGVGIAGPTLKLKPFQGLSLVRGITAISLLLQKL